MKKRYRHANFLHRHLSHPFDWWHSEPRLYGQSEQHVTDVKFIVIYQANPFVNRISCMSHASFQVIFVFGKAARAQTLPVVFLNYPRTEPFTRSGTLILGCGPPRYVLCGAIIPMNLERNEWRVHQRRPARPGFVFREHRIHHNYVYLSSFQSFG